MHANEIWLENRRRGNTLGIDEAAPRMSWLAAAPADEWEVQFERFDRTIETALVSSSRLVPWPFEPLAPRDGGSVRVRPRGQSHGWELSQHIERGLGRGDWSADFVSPSTAAAAALRPAYLMRAEFDLTDVPVAFEDVVRARLYATAHGLYQLEINGDAPFDDQLAPGWTSYRHRLRYQTYDLAPFLLPGRNAIGAWLADGWYRGHIGFDGGLWDFFGDDVALLLQIELTTRDGSVHVIDLDSTWVFDESPITAVGLYEGEAYDATRLSTAWSTAGFDDRGWRPATSLPRSRFTALLEAPTGPPVREIETIAPVAVERIENGRIRLDFGQNISGRLRIRPHGPRGHVVTLHHAEVLENGELGTRPLRGAVSVDAYTCAGTAGEEWTPRFTIHGFRYAELEGWPGSFDPADVEAVVVHTDMMRAGWFSSSNDELNQLHSNVVWSMRDNFVDLPTDCPQRDERMGWTGDIQVFAPTALYLYGAQGTLTGWLRDLAAEQWENGHVPQFVPWVECGFPNHPTAAWGDAAVIVPWSLYLEDGDTRILRDQYDSMRSWVDLVDRLTHHTGLWNSGFQLGDWLDPAAPPESPGDSHTDRYLVATAYHVRTARILARTAALLGFDVDAERYSDLAERALRAFQREFLTPSGRVVSDTPTALALCAVFELYPDDDAAAHGGARLVELVEKSRYRITTGFVGTPIICDALVLADAPDAAYRLLLQRSLPSWLYPVTMGATTIWERWDSMLPDGSINPGDMTSFNHYALGAVADFLHRRVAGLAPAAPGWRRLRIAPLPGGGLTHAEAAHETPWGTASVNWRRDHEVLTVQVTVPADVEATVQLPDGSDAVHVSAGAHTFSCRHRAAVDDPVSYTSPSWRPVESPVA